MAFKEEMEQLSVKESKFQNSKAKLVNFSYTQAAYEDDTLVNGVDEYSFEQEQNIPNGTSEVLSTNQGVLNKGVRSQASSLTRQLINHFFGRTSYNLNKIHDYFNSFISKFSAALGKENGVATLDANGRVPYSQLPESAVEIKGTWNASTNRTSIVTEEEPQGTQLINGTGTMGDFYICTVEGWFDAATGNASATETEGYEHYAENDRVMYIDGIWKRIPSGSDGAIVEINGKSGSEVNLFGTDITVSESDMRTIKQALDEAGSQITFDNEPTENSSNAATSGGIWSAALGGRIPDSSITSFNAMNKPGRYYIAQPNDYSSFPTDWGTEPGILLVLSKQFEKGSGIDSFVTQIFMPVNATTKIQMQARKYIAYSDARFELLQDWTLLDLSDKNILNTKLSEDVTITATNIFSVKNSSGTTVGYPSLYLNTSTPSYESSPLFVGLSAYMGVGYTPTYYNLTPLVMVNSDNTITVGGLTYSYVTSAPVGSATYRGIILDDWIAIRNYLKLLITYSSYADSYGFVSKTFLNSNLNSYQPKLVSGSNIKTIGGQSLVGAGDIPAPVNIFPTVYASYAAKGNRTSTSSVNLDIDLLPYIPSMYKQGVGVGFYAVKVTFTVCMYPTNSTSAQNTLLAFGAELITSNSIGYFSSREDFITPTTDYAVNTAQTATRGLRCTYNDRKAYCLISNIDPDVTKLRIFLNWYASSGGSSTNHGTVEVFVTQLEIIPAFGYTD